LETANGSAATDTSDNTEAVAAAPDGETETVE
jgi:hypothetical protein